MARFTSTITQSAVVPAEREPIWDALTDPDLLARLTPLLRKIEADGDLWRWHMVSISALGVGITPVFTEQMRFTDGRRIDFDHAPPKGTTERTGADGWYELADVSGGTKLSIRLTLHVELPLPRATSPVVTGVMKATMQRTGDRFSANLLEHLGVRQG